MTDSHLDDEVYVRGIGTVSVIERIVLRQDDDRDITLYQLQDLRKLEDGEMRPLLLESTHLELVRAGATRLEMEKYLTKRRAES